MLKGDTKYMSLQLSIRVLEINTLSYLTKS